MKRLILATLAAALVLTVASPASAEEQQSFTSFEPDARHATKVAFNVSVYGSEPEYDSCIGCLVLIQKRKKSGRWVTAFTGVTDENGNFFVRKPNRRVLGKTFRVLTPAQAGFAQSVSEAYRITEWTRWYCPRCSTQEEQLAALGG